MNPIDVCLLALTGVALTSLAARRAGSLQRRAALIGRVAGASPPSARPVRSIRVAWAAVVPAAVGALQRRRAEAAYDTTLATALDGIARGVRSGGSLTQAVGEAAEATRGPVAADLARVALAVRRGVPFVDALARWRDERPRAAVRLAAGALALATQTGGPPARVIEEVAAAIRGRQQIVREAHALAAQARLSAIVVGLAPVGFMAVMCLMDPRNAQTLFATPIGLACVVTGLTLDAVGARWMHRMSAAVVA